MRTMVAIPCMDMMHSQFVMSLTGLRLDGEVKFAYSVSSLVYDSRNNLARKAICEKFDQILWLDSDMEFKPDLYKRLKEDLDQGLDLVSGLYMTRKNEIKPVVFKDCGYKPKEGTNEVMPFAHTYYDYPKDSLFECAAVGFGGVLMKVSLVKAIDEKFGLPFSPILGFGEDISFCLRAAQLGFKLHCDSRVKMGHVGNYTFEEKDYAQRS